MKIIYYIKGLLLCFIILVSGYSAEPIKAFPRAEGFGAQVTGGRGGKVFIVNNLKSKGQGSLHWALNQKGKRIVVFNVGGIIHGDIEFNSPDVTVLGQTAPSPGITIEGMLSTSWSQRKKFRKLNSIFRFLRVRQKKQRGQSTGGDCIQFSNKTDIILDHISTSWSSDESIDISAGENITIQWCSLEETDRFGHKVRDHNYAMILGYRAKNISLHHNLFAHHKRRAPLTDAVPLDYRNNVVYNMEGGIYYHEDGGQKSNWNVIGNTFIHGPNNQNPKGRSIYDTIIGAHQLVSLYAKDNYFSWVEESDPWVAASRAGGVLPQKRPRKASRPFKAPKVKTHKQKKAYELVLEQAGCWPEDSVTQRTKKEVKDRKGSWGRKNGKLLNNGLKKGRAFKDQDQDGLPDAWERAMGLNPKQSSDQLKKMKSGYPAIEEYANQLATWFVEHKGKGKGPRQGKVLK